MDYRKKIGESSITSFRKQQEQYGYDKGVFKFQSAFMDKCFNLYSHKLHGHYGCVNAIDFASGNCDLFASGGDDKRVLLWNVGECLFRPDYKPVIMIGTHVSNIFCIAFNAHNNKLMSSGNDEQVMIHDIHTRQVVNVYLREDAVYSISPHPNDPNIFITASEDGKLRLTDLRESHSGTVCLANYVSAFHGVAFNPMEPLFVAAAHSKEGAALWDTRKPKSTLLCYGSPLSRESTMSVQFNQVGSRLLVLRRKKSPRVYKTHCDIPFVEGESDRYFNSCTMKSGCFAGIRDEFFVSGSDDFKVYVWKIPDHCEDDFRVKIPAPRMVLCGHRSIVNQVRFNKQAQLLVSSGVEKYMSAWSPFKYPYFTGCIDQPSCEQTRALYSRHQYIDLVLRSGTTLTHDYETENINEDPRMIAFFDSLLLHDQNHSTGTDSSDDDNSVTRLRLLPPATASPRLEDDTSISDVSTSTDSDVTTDDDSRPSQEVYQQVRENKAFLDRETQTRLQNLRHSLRRDDDEILHPNDDVIITPSVAAQEETRRTSHTTNNSPPATAKKTSSPCSSKESRKRSYNYSSDDDERHSAMRKRNAFRRRRASKQTHDETSGSKNVADKAELCDVDSKRWENPAKISSKLESSDESLSDDSDYVRSRRKLRRSVEATNRRLENIANNMASAIENASDTSESSEDSDNSKVVLNKKDFFNDPPL